MIVHYVLDTGALIGIERGKPRVKRFVALANAGAARLVVPLPVVAEWWRGRTDRRDTILASCQVSSSLGAAKAAGVALAHLGDIEAKLTIDAMVIATAALLDGIVITGDPKDFDVLRGHFPGVAVLGV